MIVGIKSAPILRYLILRTSGARTAYLLYASDNNQNFKISRLDADYYNIAAQVNTIPGSTLEAPGIIKRNGVYYLFASHTSGWDPNPNKFFTANVSFKVIMEARIS